MANSSNWFVPSSPTYNTPGSHVAGGGGTFDAGVVQYRSTLDAKRAAHGALPYAQYP